MENLRWYDGVVATIIFLAIIVCLYLILKGKNEGEKKAPEPKKQIIAPEPKKRPAGRPKTAK